MRIRRAWRTMLKLDASFVLLWVTRVAIVLLVFVLPSVGAWFVPAPWRLGARAGRGPPPLVGGEARFSAVSEYVGLGGSSGAVVAVGDFNRDRSVDVVVLHTWSASKLGVRLWRSDSFAFVESQRRGVDISGEACPVSKVEGVSVGDFNNDGALDLLVTGGGAGCVYYGDGLGGFSEEPTVLPEVGYNGGLVMDADANMIPDLFVMFKNGTRGFWQFSLPNDRAGSRSQPATVPGAVPVAQDAVRPEVQWRPWNSGAAKDCEVGGVSVTGAAFVDLDGDCLPDLVVPTACGLEIWSNPNQGLVGGGGKDGVRAFWDMNADSDVGLLRMEGENIFNPSVGDVALTFTDFDGDGTTDIAITNRNRGDILVYLNIQMHRPHGQLCVIDLAWKLSKRVGVASGISMDDLSVGKFFERVNVKAVIRTGDYDLDGKPDLIVTDKESGSPVIYRNMGDWSEKKQSIEPHFEKIPGNGALAKASGKGSAVAAFFFDTDESGRQDIMVSSSKNRTALIWNSFITRSDSLFFKGTGLSSLAYSVSKGLQRPFAPVAGSTFKVSYMSRNKRGRVTRTCSQCSQSGPWSLQVCSCLFGLLEISNYIEEMVMGAGAEIRAWTNLTPNSMAVVWADSVAGWKMEYFTQRRGGQMLRVVIILTITLVLLGAGIIYLQHKERKEDRESVSEQQVQLFNFGAG